MSATCEVAWCTDHESGPHADDERHAIEFRDSSLDASVSIAISVEHPQYGYELHWELTSWAGQGSHEARKAARLLIAAAGKLDEIGEIDAGR